MGLFGFSKSKRTSMRPEQATHSHRPSSNNHRHGFGPNPPSNYYAGHLPANTPQPPAGSDSPYSFLSQFDTIFLIDDSGSMAGRGWRETEAALTAITPVCTQYDVNGVDIVFLNHVNANTSPGTGAYHNVTMPVEIHEIFTSVSPRGGTPTGRRLNQILKPYLDELEARMRQQPGASSDTLLKPLNIIVITDGVPTDDLESVIVGAARKLDYLNAQAWQVGIQFFQVGNEPEAAEDLRQLDDALAGQRGIRDMVDTVPWSTQNGGVLSGDSILKVVLGAVHRKYDRKNVSRRR
ncbi:hypothetical protein LOZ58_006493 [Ophidiomyces ophidiicola]|nr:hypothetical protein LOZ66_004743 [Ophidiomyces ophidiicola]KAI1956229.1 hypothetical protein LOZ58_006493 [Ophidiomyces ophidiicola]